MVIINNILKKISRTPPQQLLTASSSISSSSSGTWGGLKKLKKLSHCSVLVIGLAFFEPFLGFFLSIFCVKVFPGYHSISVLHSKHHSLNKVEEENFQNTHNEEEYLSTKCGAAKKITQLLSPVWVHLHQ